MDRQPQRLWRKIGIQKNFLEGTSYSDQSKGTVLSREEFYEGERCVEGEVERRRKDGKQVKWAGMGRRERGQQHLGRKQRDNDGFEHVESPISRLQLSDFQQSCTQWAIQASGPNPTNIQTTPASIQQNINNLLSLAHQTQSHFITPHTSSSQSLGSYPQSWILDNNNLLVMNSDICIQSQKKQQQPSHHAQRYSQHFYHREGRGVAMHVVRASRGEGEGGVGMGRGRAVKGGDWEDEGGGVEVVECEEMVEVTVRESDRLLRVQEKWTSFRLNKLPLILNQLTHLKHLHTSTHLSITTLLRTHHTYLTTTLPSLLQTTTQHLLDQLSYLYQQNTTLLTKLHQKQSFTKKTLQQLQRLSEQLEGIRGEREREDREKEELIARQSNQINRLCEVVEDWEGKVEEWEKRVEVYEGRVEVYEGRVEGYERKIEECEKKIQNYERKIKGYQKRELQLQQKFHNAQTHLHQKQHQLTQLATHLDTIQYTLNGQYQQHLQTLQHQHLTQLNHLKAIHHHQLQHLRTNIIETTNKQYQAVMGELLKRVGRVEVEGIVKRFSISGKNRCLNGLGGGSHNNKGANENRRVKQSQLNDNFRSVKKLLLQNVMNQQNLDDSTRLGDPIPRHHPYHDSPHGSTKNLKNTGFFGQVTDGPNPIHDTPNFNLDQEKRRYNTQRSEFNEELGCYRTSISRESQSMGRRRKTERSPEGQFHVGRSFGSLFREEGEDGSQDNGVITIGIKGEHWKEGRNIQSSSSSCSQPHYSPRRRNSQMSPHNNDQQNDQKHLKVCQTGRQYITSSSGHDISFTTNTNYHQGNDQRELIEERGVGEGQRGRRDGGKEGQYRYSYSQLDLKGLKGMSSPTNSVSYNMGCNMNSNNNNNNDNNPNIKNNNNNKNSHRTTNPLTPNYFKTSRFSLSSSAIPKPSPPKDEIDRIVQKVKQKINSQMKGSGYNGSRQGRVGKVNGSPGRGDGGIVASGNGGFKPTQFKPTWLKYDKQTRIDNNNSPITIKNPNPKSNNPNPKANPPFSHIPSFSRNTSPLQSPTAQQPTKSPLNCFQKQPNKNFVYGQSSIHQHIDPFNVNKFTPDRASCSRSNSKGLSRRKSPSLDVGRSSIVSSVGVGYSPQPIIVPPTLSSFSRQSRHSPNANTIQAKRQSIMKRIHNSNNNVQGQTINSTHFHDANRQQSSLSYGGSLMPKTSGNFKR